MTYDEAIAYLLSFADFERSGRFQDRPDVAPMIALLHALGGPHLGRRTVHVAGSKGKGSVAAIVESILRAGGFRTGLYTSPHLHSYTERIRIDGRPISESNFARLTKELCTAVDAVRAKIGERSFVTFDLLTAVGFLAFREARVEVQVIEVGLGGRVDSTNVFETKDVAVITPLSLEHTAVLGDTIEQIAQEKAAIITPRCAAVVAPQPYPEGARVVRVRADEVGAAVIDVSAEYRWPVLERDRRGQRLRIQGSVGAVEARLPLIGAHEAENAATAVAAVHALADSAARGGEASPAPTAEQIVTGLETVSWPGRMEVLSEDPLVVADGAHNRDSARRLREALVEYFGAQDVTFVVGVGADKDIAGLAEELALVAGRVLAVRADHPRAMEPERIEAVFRGLRVETSVGGSVREAIGAALAVNGTGGLICLVGSLFVAAEGREYFGLTMTG